MTFLYTRTNTWSSAPQPTEETIKYWKHISQKKNWRIVQLPNGFLQTEYKSIDSDDWIDVTRRETVARTCLLYTSPSPRDRTRSRMPSSA